MQDEKIRSQLVEYGKRLMADGLVSGPGGNLSAREGERIYVSPSGFAFDELAPGDYVGIDIESGEIVDGEHRPTSEFLMHLFCYRKRPDIGAVVHTHPKYTVALTCSGNDLKTIFPDFHIYTNSKVPHIEYVTVTTPEMARAVEAVIDDANAAILRNHGAVTLGSNLKEAYYRMCSLEEGAQIQWMASLVGQPRFLTESECNDLDQLKSEQYRRRLLAEAKQT